MDDFCDLHGTPDTPVSRIVTAKVLQKAKVPNRKPSSFVVVEDVDAKPYKLNFMRAFNRKSVKV